MTEVKLEPSWKKVIGGEFNKAYMQQLKAFLVAEKQAGKTIYPKGCEYFQAFSLTPFEEVKVVILGQDPYHGPGQAHGLCFSVRPKVKIPPSLINIYKELQADLGITPPQHGCLEGWAKQGVLLLNSVLTVEQGRAAAHQGRGWEQFTDHAISALNQSREGVVFMLWGAYAQKKGSYIDTSKHLVLKSVHPSPLSAHRGFLGCKHFSQANHYLQQQGKTPIDWQLPIQMEQMAYAQA
ncbi:uracil-DNA glycosylase [Zooshikella ganghwensis]|uniref:Uracil-DNA glycosylase n=1 Tax=Zooshikella ganghwensis TaxID=202772 RepID=A0A4P9VNP8_9GAMM|nr:uracil-DNA glycosylase [Zooshikella ganghwensis]RDH45085.1 uracil-DNA glycosylase [Zooshikella ganghwensis]